MDEWQFERAQEIEQNQRDDARRRNSLRLENEKHPDFDGLNCIRCGDDIPAERLAMGKIRCVPCQELKEKRG